MGKNQKRKRKSILSSRLWNIHTHTVWWYSKSNFFSKIHQKNQKQNQNKKLFWCGFSISVSFLSFSLSNWLSIIEKIIIMFADDDDDDDATKTKNNNSIKIFKYKDYYFLTNFHFLIRWLERKISFFFLQFLWNINWFFFC